MPIFNVIDCKHKDLTKIYLFSFSIFSKSSIAKNILVFKNQNIFQKDLDKTDKN